MTGEAPPAAHQYLDFELEIGPGQGREYPVAVLRAPAGEARATMRFPFDGLALENRLLALSNALYKSAAKYRAIPTPEKQTVMDFGVNMFDALICGAVRTCFEDSKEQARQQGKGLRLKLCIAAPELLNLPWEYLYDPEEHDYLCLSKETPVVRYLDSRFPPKPLAVAPPLRILGLCANPLGTPKLDTTNEKKRLNRALDDLKQRGLVEVTWLKGQGWHDLQVALRNGVWHVFHFIGHGAFDQVTGEGQLALADENGRAKPLGAEAFARLLGQHRSMRLAFLNACSGAQARTDDPFSSLAAALVRRGLPAAVAMQYPITDRAALVLSRVFYEALSDGLPVDAAVSEARLAVSLALQNTLEWGTPVLFMRSPDGELFRFQPPAGSGRPSTAAEPTPPAPKIGIEPAHGVTATTAADSSVPSRPAAASSGSKPDSDDAFAWLEGLGVKQGAKEALLLPPEERAEQPPEWVQQAIEQAEAERKRPQEPAQPRVVEKEEKAPPPAEITLDLNGVPLGLARIPAGEFLMGSGQQRDRQAVDNELPQHEVFLSEYSIGKYPVTNCQYRQYVAATRAKAPYGWKNGEYPQGLDDHPVVHVSWNAAAAFCRWASEVSGQPVRLPSEAQWEKAARGGLKIPRLPGAAELVDNPLPGRIYPWGDRFDAQVCNVSESRTGGTTPAGKYSPGGDSPYGCADLAGNVWEWTSSLYKPYPYRPDDGREDWKASGPRVWRGGSFLGLDWFARCTSRSGGYPGNEHYYLGFRAGVSPFAADL